MERFIFQEVFKGTGQGLKSVGSIDVVSLQLQHIDFLGKKKILSIYNPLIVFGREVVV